LLVNVKLDIDTFRCRTSRKLYRGSVNISLGREKSTISKANLTGRSEDGFYVGSENIDTHNLANGRLIL